MTNTIPSQSRQRWVVHPADQADLVARAAQRISFDISRRRGAIVREWLAIERGDADSGRVPRYWIVDSQQVISDEECWKFPLFEISRQTHTAIGKCEDRTSHSEVKKSAAGFYWRAESLHYRHA